MIVARTRISVGREKFVVKTPAGVRRAIPATLLVVPALILTSVRWRGMNVGLMQSALTLKEITFALASLGLKDLHLGPFVWIQMNAT